MFGANLRLRKTPSSLSPSANSVGNGRNTQDLAFTAVVLGGLLMDSRIRLSVFDPIIRHPFPSREATVNIKPMLERLQSAMGRNDLIERMLLLPGASSATAENKSVNLIVGYNKSPSSQTALDVTLWIAHQTRLATQKQVTVQVVYVVDDKGSQYGNDFSLEAYTRSTSIDQMPLQLVAAASRSATLPTQSGQALAATRTTLLDPSYLSAVFYDDHFEQADQILWQARSLAKEWGEYCKAHLRFGCVAAELKKVVESEAATLLFLGCNSVNHPVVQELGADFPCSVLGIPTTLNE